MALEIIFEADQKYFEYLWNKKKQEQKEVEQIIDQPDKKIIRRAKKEKLSVIISARQQRLSEFPGRDYITG